MSFVDILFILILAALIILAIAAIINRGKNKCGGCLGCGGRETCQGKENSNEPYSS